MEYWIFIGVIAVFVVLVTIKGYFEGKKNKRGFVIRVKREYGEFPQREYKAEQYANIAKYFLRHRSGFYIDDITWNDLEMDRLFLLMNHTYSSAGEEYLYAMLRQPKEKKEDLEETERLVQYFDAHEEERVQMQLLFSAIGKTGKFSMYDYLDYLSNLGERKNTSQYVINCLYLVAAAIMPFDIGVGILLLVTLLGYNITTYFREKAEIDPYITSFSYVIRMLTGVGTLKTIQIPELDAYKRKLFDCKKKFRKFKKSASYVMADSASGNPLDFLMDYLKMIFHLDIIKFNAMLSELRQHTDVVDEMVQIFGFLESTISIAAFRASIPHYCIPRFHEKGGLHASELYHPYIADAVPNDITAERGVLLTGSNASGKSTFLKTVALNAIMAQTIHTATAGRFESDMFRLYSSMSLRDDLEGGESYYMVEIKSLKRILDAAQEEGNPVLCFVDEVLRGTNTVERIAASTQILKSLAKPGVICFAATHDIELTGLLEQQYDNYHFTEEVVDGDVLFNYKLLDGKATTRNAIKLLSMIGYQAEIIEAADEMAAEFTKTGRWEK